MAEPVPALSFDMTLQRVVQAAEDLARRCGMPEVTTDCMLIALLTARRSTSRKLGIQLGYSAIQLAKLMEPLRGLHYTAILPHEDRPIG